MNESTRNAAIRTALRPLGHHPAAKAVLADLDARQPVSQPTIDRLLARADGASSGERILLDLVLVLLDYSAEQAPSAHPARAMYLGDQCMRAYVGALMLVATDGGGRPMDARMLASVVGA